MKTSYKCSICGYFTLDQRGVYEIRPVCFWQDDPSSYHEGGPNGMSIEKAKENYRKFGAVRKEVTKYARKPYVEEIDETKAGTARLKRKIIDEINKSDNRSAEFAEMAADKILYSGNSDMSVLQIKQILAQSSIRVLKSYRLVCKITHLINLFEI